ncbi:helix-turn-helix domain-containing protein [Nocardia huaxiensis]|uniref:Helix-turn-helix domain-containing protein n=1 Tax=Nocardia huaxiensis TaxID=2755382 RepID=A0A7D6VIP5_9NOCA|nr:helix-turn-helix domain-containing protein [Nocardia huaxiensis]QLY33835.1 helix-turn-helix domain-containing protein [Nocardia huaxiensis]
MRKVVALALDGLITYDLTCVVQAFRWCPGKDGEPLAFRLDTCGVRPGRVETPDGFAIHVDHGLEALTDADIVVVPGRLPGPVPSEVLDALRAASARGATMVSICIGAFVLAEAGILDGRPATTHWAFCADFARAYPAVRLDSGALYVDDGDVLTSAGLSAGWDLCLHIVRRELGASIAADVARWNVRPPHREGGQAQYIPNPVRNNGMRGRLAATLDWAAADPAPELAVPALAEHALMSERTFIRTFKSEVGTTPRRWLDAQRTARARELLETTELPVEVVASQAGFGSVTAMRVHLRAATGTTPAEYRRTLRR